MTLTERKLRKNQQDDRRFRQFAREIVTEICCFIGSLAWLSFFGYVVCQAVAEKWR